MFGSSPALAMLATIDEVEASPTKLMMFATQRTGDGLYMQRERTRSLANSLVVCVVREQEIMPFFSAGRWTIDANDTVLSLGATVAAEASASCAAEFLSKTAKPPRPPQTSKTP